jgi:hypothetical protein
MRQHLLVTVSVLSLLCLAGQAEAESFTITTPDNTTPQSLDAGETGTVTETGELEVTGDPAIDLNGGNITVDNSGLIKSFTDDAIDGEVDDFTLFNRAGAEISSDGGRAIDLDEGERATITNWGDITSTDDDAIRAGTDANITNHDGANIISAVGGDEAIQIISGTVTNHGWIEAKNDKGIQLNNGTVTNTGTIIGADSGIDTDGDGFITVINSGTIRGIGDTGVNSDFAGEVVNEVAGLIEGVNEDGIDFDGTATIENAGTIRSLATTDGEGITIGGGSVTNTGLIESAQNAIFFVSSDSDPHRTDDGAMVNSGTIQAGSGYAIRFFDDQDGEPDIRDDSIFNSGTIVGDILYGSGDDLLSLLAGSRITGDIDMGDGNNTIHFGDGLSADIVVSGVDNIDTEGKPFVVEKGRIVVVDPTGFGTTMTALTDMATAIGSVIGGRLAAAGGSGADLPAEQGYLAPAAEDAYGFWAKGFAAGSQHDGDDEQVGSENWLGGAAIGADTKATADLILGGFGGGAYGEVSTDGDGTDIETTYAFGGLYGTYQPGATAVNFLVAFGYGDNDSERTVQTNNGVDTADGSYDSLFAEAQVGIEHQYDFGGFTLTPEAIATYAGTWLDSYTETGVDSPMSVDDRFANVFEGRLGVTLGFDNGAASAGRGELDLTAGVLGRATWGDDVSAVLIGQSISFDPNGDEWVGGGYLGADLAWWIAENTKFFAGVEGTITSDDAIGGSAEAGFRVEF